MLIDTKCMKTASLCQVVSFIFKHIAFKWIRIEKGWMQMLSICRVLIKDYLHINSSINRKALKTMNVNSKRNLLSFVIICRESTWMVMIKERKLSSIK